MPKLILGSFVGLHLLVFDDWSELGRDGGCDLVEGEGLGESSYENLVIRVPFSEEYLFVVVGELLERAYFFNFGRRYHHKCLIFALLPPQEDILAPQTRPRQQLHY